MSRPDRRIPDRFESQFPLADWANQDPAWRWPAVLVALLLLWGLAGWFDLQDQLALHGALGALPSPDSLGGIVLAASAFGAPSGTVIDFSTDARHADRSDRLARHQAEQTSHAMHRSALIAARLDGDEAGFLRGWRRGSAAGFWLGSLLGAAAGAGVLQLLQTLRDYGGIAAFLASFIG